MAVLLALASAVVYGTSDFLGGLASRRASVFGVVALSQVFGLVALLALLPWLGGPVGVVDLAWGVAAGLAGATGLVIFFRTLARGVMSVVAPITAVTAAAVPVLVACSGASASASGPGWASSWRWSPSSSCRRKAACRRCARPGRRAFHPRSPPARPSASSSCSSTAPATTPG